MSGPSAAAREGGAPTASGSASARAARARAIAEAGGLDAALSSGALERFQDLSASEAVVLGLLRQGVSTYIGVFGHGCTDLGEALRVYAEAGLVAVYDVHSEIEASHAASALRRVYGLPSAVFASIGPGSLQAMAASIVPASDGLGVYYLLGDETTHDEGFNMQQVPRHEQMSFLALGKAMGRAYSLHTGEAVSAALRRGASTVFASAGAAPFYLFLPMNVQGRVMSGFNIDELPSVPAPIRQAPADGAAYEEAAALLARARRVVVKTGNGARGVDPESMRELIDRADAAYVHGPQAVGIVSGSNPRNMTVGGSKGSSSGNAVMAEADLVVAIGARAVCQWDSSGTAWKSVERVIAINADPADAAHYNRSLQLVGDAGAIVGKLVEALRRAGIDKGSRASKWYARMRALRAEWDAFVAARVSVEPLPDQKFGQELLTQPAAIYEALSFAREKGAVKLFDAGDVQANGFQLVEDDDPYQTMTDTGASYMGFASCALLSSAFAPSPRYMIAFTGDGGFAMNPQILFDAVHHGARGMVIVFDNRKMAAIDGLQTSQYGASWRTGDETVVDYAAMARAVRGVAGFDAGTDRASLRNALEGAYAHLGLSLVHVRVYSGPDPRGGLGVYGDWNVGPWCELVQREKHRIGL